MQHYLTCSVDHGSNREPCGSVRATNRTVPNPTVRFVSETEPRRHGSVRGGHKPRRFVRFATVRDFAHGHIIHHFMNTLPPCLFTLFHIVHEHAFYFSVFLPTVANCQVAQFTVFTHMVDVPARGRILVSPFISRFSCMLSHFASSLFRVVL